MNNYTVSVDSSRYPLYITYWNSKTKGITFSRVKNDSFSLDSKEAIKLARELFKRKYGLIQFELDTRSIK